MERKQVGDQEFYVKKNTDFAVADAESTVYFHIVAVCLPSLTNPTFFKSRKAFRGKALGEFLQQLILLMF